MHVLDGGGLDPSQGAELYGSLVGVDLLLHLLVLVHRVSYHYLKLDAFLNNRRVAICDGEQLLLQLPESFAGLDEFSSRYQAER